MIGLLFILAAAPGSSAEAARLHQQGLDLYYQHVGKTREAVEMLEKAMQLAPDVALYVGDYGGTCLQLADEEKSYRYAVRGRDALQKAVAMDPKYVDAREALMQFYAFAPWPLGDAGKAQSEAAEIARIDPKTGVKDEVKLAGIFEKKGKKSDALAAYRAAAKLDPQSAAALDGIHRLQ